MIFLNEKYLEIISFFILIGLLTLVSCKEEKSVEPESGNELVLIHPSGGERLTGGDQYTIQIKNTDLYDSLSFFYSLNNGASYQPMHMIENSDGLYIWQLPWENSTNVKIRILAYAQGKIYVFISEYVFEITGSSLKILEPSSNDVFTDPKFIQINWNTSIPFNRYALYYSKYNQTVIKYGNPDNKIEYSSEWILLDDNINGKFREFIWENPYLYSNKVRIKLIGFLNNEQYEILSDVFTVHLEEILSEESQYQEKLAVNNKWVYKITEDYFGEVWGDYYVVKDVISLAVEDGKIYYEIKEETIRDTVSYKYHKLIDREYYYSDYILQDGDLFTRENFTSHNGNWNIYLRYSNSCKVYNEMVFSEELLIKEYNSTDASSGSSSETIKRAKEVGIYNKIYNSEGFHRTTNLMGALIDGVVYGDTTVVR
jgi:hypothetical protein